jgi:hypothetical protein
MVADGVSAAILALGWPALTSCAVLDSTVIEYSTYWQVLKNDG